MIRHHKKWPRFSLPQLCHTNICVMVIVKVIIQNLFNCLQRTCMHYCKVHLLSAKRKHLFIHVRKFKFESYKDLFLTSLPQ